MDRFHEIEYKGKRILCVNLAGVQLKDKSEFYLAIELLREHVSMAAPKSLLVITNVTNSPFDSDIARTMRACAQHNAPYVKASAIIGLSGIQKVVLAAIKNFTKREFYLTDSIDQAQDWLVNQQ